MKILYLSAHSILEYDQVKLWSQLGYDVFSLGSYLDPMVPGDDKRPPILEAADHPELREIVHRMPGPDKTWNAKGNLPSDLIDWADVILVDALPKDWIGRQWDRINGKRVIWRTIGQSGPDTEAAMQPYRSKGLEIVRYSPAERRAYEPFDWFAGEDAMIRFGKDPEEWYGWTGSDPVVGNVTQNMVERAEFCGLRFWRLATEGLPVKPAGAGSEKLGGVGQLTYDGLRDYLRSIRVTLYTGTQPASYTLGLIEAMMTGCPVVSIGPEWMWAPPLFEGHEIAGAFDDAWPVRVYLDECLDSPHYARVNGEHCRERAVDLFGIETVGRQWRDYLGGGKDGYVRDVRTRSGLGSPDGATAEAQLHVNVAAERILA